jgi:hypothetical protein
MAWLFGEMFLVPIRTFIFGMERLLETMRGFQQAGDRGMELMTGGRTAVDTKPQDTTASPPSGLEKSDSTQQAASGGTETELEETKMDKDLNDDMLKLVRYKILFVKRGYEHAFKEEEELVPDNIDGPAFTAWKIAEFIQKLHKKAVDVSDKWEDYCKDYVTGDKKSGFKVTGLEEGDKKYLRLYYEVLERYNRQKLRYEEEHIELLKEQAGHLKKLADCTCKEDKEDKEDKNVKAPGTSVATVTTPASGTPKSAAGV